jgi:hypothetical protein
VGEGEKLSVILQKLLSASLLERSLGGKHNSTLMYRWRFLPSFHAAVFPFTEVAACPYIMMHLNFIERGDSLVLHFASSGPSFPQVV